LDVCGFPKDNFWYYKAWWGKDPVLHLFPHWNWAGKEGQEIDVWCHGNVDRVELFLNGALLGTKEMPRLGHIEWKVRYRPGTLLAKGWKDGKVILESKVETTGKPHSIRLTPYGTKMKADGEDVVPVEVAILDKQGRVVSTASNEVVFKVTGPGEIAGVGNGDPSSHEPDIASKRRAFNGLCAVFVKAGEKAGNLRLTASSKGLKDSSIRLSSK
jgi:beta-galactosidase